MAYTIALIADNHFVQTSNGVYVNGTYTKQYLSRFTSNFDKVVVIARGHKATTHDNVSNLRESGGDKVFFQIIDDFVGIKSYILNRRTIQKQIEKGLMNVDAVFVRMPCILTTLSLSIAKKLNKPIFIDVGADPETIYLGSRKTLFRRLLSLYLKNVCKRSCMFANGVSYVTEYILQEKYPCKAIKAGESEKYFTASISNVDISSDFYYNRSLKEYETNTIKLLHISNNIPKNSSKGHQEALSVLSYLHKKGFQAKLTFLGDGDGVSELKNMATKLGISDYVFFEGRVADRNEYRNYLLDNDIFVFPSHSEGLPRVLLEAMATGMICVSSNVDGIPEILGKEDIFDYSNIEGMGDRIINIITNKEVMSRISEKNFNTALNYSHDKLKQKIDSYYGKVRSLIKVFNR